MRRAVAPSEFLSRVLLWMPLLASLVSAGAVAASDGVAECIDANERSVDLRKQGHLLDARRALATCASATCPDMIQRTCAARMAEVNRAMPSLALEAQDGAGRPLAAVQVSIDGQSAVPLTATAIGVDPGSHTLRFEAPGQPAVEQTVVVVEGEKEKRVTAVLGPRAAPMGRLVVSVDAAATVRVDGREVGVGRFDGSLAPGPHDVAVSEPGKEPYQAQVELREGETRTLSLGLADAKTKGGAAVWPWIVGGVVVAAGAAVGGYLLFKPSDTTQGVPPGTTATVQLAGAWRMR